MRVQDFLVVNAQECDGVRRGSFATDAVPALIANISCLMSAMSSTAAPQMPRFAVKSTAGNDPYQPVTIS